MTLLKTVAPLRSILSAVLVCALTALLATPLRAVLAEANIVMLFLLVVVLVSVGLGRLAGVVAAFVSVGLFDLFFVEPRFSFSVDDAQYLVTFAVMLVVALVIGALASGLREQAVAAQVQAAQAQSLYGLAKQLASALTVEQVHGATAYFLDETLNLEAVFVLPNADERLDIFAGAKLSNVEMVMAHAAYDHNNIQEMGYHNDGDHSSTHLPLQGATRLRGVLVARSSISMTNELVHDRAMLEAVASIVAASIERLHFVVVAQSAQWAAGSERLRSSILSALSHDIRTPLTALYGMADGLHFNEPPLPPNALTTVDALCGQALQLNTMVSNLLDMAKLQAGTAVLRREWQPLEEVVGASIAMLGAALRPHGVRVDLADDVPLLHFDAVLLERVLCNLLENAAKYACADESPIVLRASVDGAFVRVSVENLGEPIAVDKLTRIFDLFERGQVESSVHGTGIGLSICRSIVEAHGGRIFAENIADGVRVVFTLPLGVAPVFSDELV